MVTSPLPQWVVRVNKKHTELVVAGTIVCALLIRLTREEITSVLLQVGTTAPFGLLPAYQWVQFFILVAVAWILYSAGFGLGSCIAVNFVILIAYFVPLSRPMGWGGPLLWVYVFKLGFISSAACLSGTVGFLMGTLTRRSRR